MRHLALQCSPVLSNPLCAQRMLLWQRRNNTVAPFNETVQQVFARISALRDALDGPQTDDQGMLL